MEIGDSASKRIEEKFLTAKKGLDKPTTGEINDWFQVSARIDLVEKYWPGYTKRGNRK